MQNRAELEACAERLAAAAVVDSGVAPTNSIPGAAVLDFRDPDNIAVELFVEPSSATPDDGS